jgi:rhamnosyl/mannosyltransferase
VRVLHFFKSYWPEVYAGVGRAIDAIANATADHDIEHHVLSINDDGLYQTNQFHGQFLHKARRSFLIYSTDFSYDAFRKYNKLAADADIIQLHFPWPFMDLVHLASRTKKPTILTYHADALAKPIPEALYKPVMHLLLTKVDRIVATSPNYAATSKVLNQYSNKTEVIPLGLDSAAYKDPCSTIVEKWRQIVGSDFFLFIGALRHYKGLETLLEAARLTQFPVVIAGSGKTKHELQGIKTQLALNNVTFLGDISEEDKIALLKLCKAFVFPSNKRSEAFGLSLVEAAMMGKPMISCEIGTGTSFVNKDGETGIVVPPDDPGAFADAMMKIDQDPNLAQERGLAAKRHFERELHAKLMGERYLALYDKVLREKNR